MFETLQEKTEEKAMVQGLIYAVGDKQRPHFLFCADP